MASQLHYFMDWRPVGALPADHSAISVRVRSITLDDISDYIDRTRGSAPVLIPDVGLCQGATILARPDGIFVSQVETDTSFPSSDLDELGWVISGVAKERLGHIHDVHRASRHPTKSLLTPSKTLVVYPVRLAEAGWALRFQRRAFNDADLRKARCDLPAKAPQNVRPRNALVCLRRAYLKVFEDLSGRLAVDRSLQAAWQTGRWRWILVPLGLLVIVALYLIMVEWPKNWEEVWRSLSPPPPELIVAVATILPAFYIFASYFAQVVKWDTPRIQLLRSAVLFYEYASPLNRVIAQIMRQPTDGFGDVIAVLKTKAEGEVHRTAVHQTWLALALGFAGLMFAALAIRGADQKGPIGSTLAISRVERVQSVTESPAKAREPVPNSVSLEQQQPPSLPLKSSGRASTVGPSSATTIGPAGRVQVDPPGPKSQASPRPGVSPES